MRIPDLFGVRVKRLERELKKLQEDLKAKIIDDEERDRRLRALEYTANKVTKQF